MHFRDECAQEERGDIIKSSAQALLLLINGICETVSAFRRGV